ncbi:CLUMA_CG004756, isoform A [Clunio marinus]|uniref:CLUMA_CG004756, isoform A n=1 Tax=Clunio marinus TaxID=568069 RepID=A0A1J1HUM4_9DIPT|nr:CLUMA_CG004756, isoform A [Clunio marinus]
MFNYYNKVAGEYQEVKIKYEETLITFETTKHVTEAINEEQSAPHKETTNAMASSTNVPQDKSKKPTKCLNVHVKYNALKEILILDFRAYEYEWNLISIIGFYHNFDIARIPEDSFKSILDDELPLECFYPKANDNYQKIFKVDISKIERHVFRKEFTIEISYMLLDDVDKKIFRSKYDFDLHEALTNDDINILTEINQYQRQPLATRTHNFFRMIKYALNVEDLESQNELKEFILPHIQLEYSKDSKQYWIPIEGYQLPRDYKEMSICLVPMEKYREGKMNFEKDCIYSQIENYMNGKIYLVKKIPNFHQPQSKPTLNLSCKYCLRFIPNRITYRACFQAIETIGVHGLSDYFNDFEYSGFDKYRVKDNIIEDFSWFNKQIETNEEQKTAIKNIVNCTAYPFPYVVFGPPGTGKTTLIVECIAQILKERPTNHILVTAQSNSACDEIGNRLLKFIPRGKIYRFYSSSLLNSGNAEASQVLLETSNLRNGNNEYPTKEEFFHFNVVIITLTTCSRLVQAKCDNINKHFDYIFVDECAAATEPEAYIPIVGFGTGDRNITTNVVLIGDHKQFGPAVKSHFAEDLGLGVSLMERIMTKSKYKLRPDNSYDQKYITQLLNNFRSHPAILQFSNILFYNSKLRAKISEPERSLGTRWNFIRNKKFPILFHCTKTPSQIVINGTSSFNEGEIEKVKFYVDILLMKGIDGVKINPDDIGIVSPYKAQLLKLKQKFNAEIYRNLEMGTAEYYQGREKKIIIISTVKSYGSVGFLKCEKRLNVCITRAKSLLILIGNGDTLKQNPLWNSFLQFCEANDGCVGKTNTIFGGFGQCQQENKIAEIGQITGKNGIKQNGIHSFKNFLKF